jgi:hypothetical protein
MGEACQEKTGNPFLNLKKFWRHPHPPQNFIDFQTCKESPNIIEHRSNLNGSPIGMREQ